MRSKFGKKDRNIDGHGWESDFGFVEHAASPDQVALVGGNENEVVSAIPVPASVSGSYDLDVARLPSDFNLFQALKMRRENHFDQGAITSATNFLTVVSDFSERTRILSLDGQTLALDDFALTEWLVNAERQMLSGTDGFPIFETALEDTVCSVCRLPNGLVTMTEVPRRQIEMTRENLRGIFGENSITQTSLTIETPLRTVARYFLTTMPQGASALRVEKQLEVTAFLIITRNGFSYGLWSPTAGLFSEYAFLAPKEIIGDKPSWSVNSAAVSAKEPYQKNLGLNAKRDDSGESEFGIGDQLNNYIEHAFDQLFLQLSPEKLEQLQLTAYSQIVWTTELGMAESVAPVADSYAEKSGLDFIRLDVPMDEAAAGGLLFGSFTFGDETVAGAQILPPVNLARDLLILADKEEVSRRIQEEAGFYKMRSNAVFALLAPPIMVLACVLALAADIVRQKFTLSYRDFAATQKTAELKPALDRRKSYEETLKWYQAFITEVSALRKQQPVGIGMLYELNNNYPLTVDPAFYVSELKLLPNGNVEMKGLARNKDAVTSFLRSLEFAGGQGSGTRLFKNLTYEVQEGSPPAVIPAGAQTGTTPLATNNLAPGVVSWNIKGSYLPIEEFLPPAPAKNGAAPPPNPAVNAANNAANPPTVPPAATTPNQ